MASLSCRTAPWVAMLASGLLASLSQGSALAQSAGGAPSALAPTLRGPVEDPADESPATLETNTLAPAPAGALPSDQTDAETPAPALPLGKFPLPKTQAKTQDRVKLPRRGPPPLPTLLPYPTALRLRGGVPIADTTSNSLPTPTIAALPVPTRQKVKVIDDGYTPLGLKTGTLIVTPYVTQSLGYDSNPDQVTTGIKPSGFSRTEGGIGVLSNWPSNELKADLRGGYNDYFSDRGANRPDATGTIDFRVDVNRDTTLDAEQRFSIDTQRPGSPDVSVNTVSRPLIIGFGETFGGTESFGRVSVGLHGSFDRVAYDNATLSNGSVQDLANGNYNDYGLRLRTSYEITPVFKPFVDILVDDRLHDATIDLSGFRRDSVGIIGQAGTSFEFNRLLSGEVSAGYGTRSYDDNRLKALNGPVVNATVSYAASPLTTIGLLASTTFDETTVAGSSGAQSRSLTLNVTHQLLRNLTLTGAITYLNTDYSGAPITENTLSESLKADYHLSRSLVATAAYTHQDLHSSAVGSSYVQDVILFGLRLQR